ncbi:MAG: quinone-dependent dihydroorotate dehydrogenase, partial [Propionibacteriaceae bacterium]
MAVGYRGLVRPLLFRAYGGNPERVHEQTLAAIARIGRSRPALAALARFGARHRTPATVAGIQFLG